MTEGTYRLDLDKIPITLATLPQMEVMYGYHEEVFVNNVTRFTTHV